MSGGRDFAINVLQSAIDTVVECKQSERDFMQRYYLSHLDEVLNEYPAPVAINGRIVGDEACLMVGSALGTTRRYLQDGGDLAAVLQSVSFDLEAALSLFVD